MKHQNPRNTLGDISVLYIHVLNRALSHCGQDPTPLMQRFDLDQKTLATPEARISIPRFMRLGHAACELTGNPALGLIMGQQSRPVDAGIAGLAAASAPTAGRALETLIRYSALTSRNSRGAPTTDMQGRIASFYSIKPYNAFNYFVVDSVLAAWTHFLRTITGLEEVIETVEIEYPARGLEERFEEWFLCPVAFGASHNRLTLKAGMEAHPSLQSQPAMYEALSSDCRRQLEKIRTGWTMEDRVRELLTPRLQGEPPTLEDIAVRLATTPWTLQRKLTSEGTGFRELLDVTRRDLCADYMRETDLSLAEIAWLLGFSGPAAFQKAYRRWFDISPGEHRKQIKRIRG